MLDALKARDLQRDPRFALHSGSDEPDDWVGDAKLAGIVEEVSAPGATSTASGSDLHRGVDRRPR